MKLLTHDVNKSWKNFQMIKIRLFSIPAHKNLIQYHIVGRPNQDLSIIKGENLCVMGP